MAHFKRAARALLIGIAATLTLLYAAALRAGETNCIAAKVLNDLHQENPHLFESASLDHRFVLPRERAAFHVFDRVGAVAIKGTLTGQRWLKSGSGTLINACYVLTSYHVVFPDMADFSASRKVMFSFGVPAQAGKPFKYAIEGTPVSLELFDPRRPVHLLDQVLVRLHERVPSAYAPAEFAALPAQDYGAEVYACGYPGEMDTFRDTAQPLYCDKCQIKGYHSARGYETNCTMPAGTSGGAVFRLLPDATCDPDRTLALLGAPNQSPEPELFPKDHPRIRSFVTDYGKTAQIIRKIVDQDDCGVLAEAQARGATMQGYQ